LIIGEGLDRTGMWLGQSELGIGFCQVSLNGVRVEGQ
jgi:hypothetical protein